MPFTDDEKRKIEKRFSAEFSASFPKCQRCKERAPRRYFDTHAEKCMKCQGYPPPLAYSKFFDAWYHRYWLKLPKKTSKYSQAPKITSNVATLDYIKKLDKNFYEYQVSFSVAGEYPVKGWKAGTRKAVLVEIHTLIQQYNERWKNFLEQKITRAFIHDPKESGGYIHYAVFGRGEVPESTRKIRTKGD